MNYVWRCYADDMRPLRALRTTNILLTVCVFRDGILLYGKLVRDEKEHSNSNLQNTEQKKTDFY